MCLKKLTTEEFIAKAIKVHGNRYGYLLVDYIDSRHTVKVVCPIHGVFEQMGNIHLQGSGCPMCKVEMTKQICGKPLQSFINDCYKIHGKKYGYSMVIYVNNRTKVRIICPIHGVFEQEPSAHLKGSGCPVCAGLAIAKSKTQTTEEFIKKARLVHGNRFEYSFVDYKGSKTKVLIICPIHGVFEQTPHNHLQGCGCPVCRASKGERKVEQYLIENNIKYIRQYKFNDCRGKKRSLSFDFYLPDWNILIEYDGEYHYIARKHHDNQLGMIKLKEYQQRDKIKDDYCLKNNIRLIRIPYWDFKNIKKILNQQLIVI